MTQILNNEGLTVAEAVNKRKLVTLRKIEAIEPIEGADAIEVATVEGWKVVVKKGEFPRGSYCVYFEIDSFLPDGNPAWQFLVDKQPKMFEDVKGHKLRTIKLRGQVSQGFVAHVSMFPEIVNFAMSTVLDHNFCEDDYASLRSEDFAPMLGIKKWEAALPACLSGQAEGLFPSDIQKTDQERCQNLVNEIFGYEDRTFEFDIEKNPQEALDAMCERGETIWDDESFKWLKVLKAKADRNARYEVSLKLDGSSGTYFVRGARNDSEIEPVVGVCSRNLQLKISDENKDNTFVRVLFDTRLNEALTKYFQKTGIEIAVQGEVMGPSIQGNREGFTKVAFFVFDIYNMTERRYMSADERAEALAIIAEVTGDLVLQAPVLHASVTLDELGITDVAGLLAFAEGPSINHKVREGLVFKRLDGQFSFKAISNKFLAGEKD